MQPNPSNTSSINSLSCLLLYFHSDSPDKFGNILKKCIFKYEPYFYIIIKENIIEDFQQHISKRFEGKISSTEIIEKLDLDMPNHLAGLKRKALKVNFKNISNLITVRNYLRPIVEKNKAKEKFLSYSEILNPSEKIDILEKIEELREDDIPYHVRCCIDKEIRCGLWYKVSYDRDNGCLLENLPEKLTKNPSTVLAFDIETTKAPLKFPDPRIDSIMLISYMIDGDGFLITNRSIISEEIEDFQYTPKPEFDGHFHIFNEKDEEHLLKRFVNHCKERRPNIFVTFNGDYFDIPFIAERLKVYNMNIESALGIQNITTSSKPGEGEYMGRFSIHIDCLYWVKRDAFLPQGSHGLKAVTKVKLGYNPIEVDAEKMLQSAKETPKQFCAYSVSDALATYYLYKLMIHDFIFALCTIIPSNPDEVLRKGSGTLCEELLMAQAFRRDIIFPPKQVTEFGRFYNGNLIDTDTYIGGTVECLNVGIYRVDIPTEFYFDKDAYNYLIENIRNFMNFNLEIENKGKYKPEEITNYEEVYNDILIKLKSLYKIASENKPVSILPIIYHLDVGAMYPNIILTNKLQPVAITNDQRCAKCLYNKEKDCKREMEWKWRGELFPLTRSEFELLKHQFEFELLNSVDDNEIEDLNVNDYYKKLIKRIKTYCSKVYKQIHYKKIEKKSDIVCQRENSFYVDTVRNFRDRRYEFKYKVKEWKNKLEDALNKKNNDDILHAKNMIDLYDSLQLAHKIILNSFYGYVMRKGSRWFSMEMAAMTTYQGSCIITDAREFCEKIGKPLELDTDGIWSCLPKGFPEGYKLKTIDGKKINFYFAQSMLNKRTYDKYSNPIYNELKNNNNNNIEIDDEDIDINTKSNKKIPTNEDWEIRREMSVFFEVDGPYKCMVLPAAKEEGKMLKKRYIVFDFDDKIVELKGFELKRRGELKIIKIFQEEVFTQFLQGKDLKSCYDYCAEIAKRWYSILEAKGSHISDEELLDYIEESRMMSKTLEEYGNQKSTAITCAKRLSEIQGSELSKEKGLCSKFIISKKPEESPIAERAIPTIIFQSPLNVRKKLLKKWLKDYSIEDDVDMRDVIDWEYYKERLAGNILKIVIIPAAIQKIENPFPNINYPEWVSRLMSRKKNEQKSLKNFFKEISNVDRMISVSKDFEKLEISKKNDVNDNKNNNNNVKKNKIDKFLKKKIEYEENKMDVEEEKNEQNLININNDFNGWLKQQKRKWKKNRNNNNNNSNINNNNNNKISLTNFISNPDIKNLFLNNTIHIIQIKETSFGNLTLFALIKNLMVTLNIKTKRKIFINSFKQNVPEIFQHVKYSLPRNKPVLNLYEFTLEEKDFKEKFNNFNDYLINPVIEGVYETKIPLSFTMIREYGNNIKLKNKNDIKINNVNNIFNFDYNDFDTKFFNNNNNNNNINENINNINEIENNIHAHINKIYFYYSNCGSRHFIVILRFDIFKCNVYIINPLISNIEIPSLKKMIISHIKEIQLEFNVDEINDSNNNNNKYFEFDIETITKKDLKQTLKEINTYLFSILHNNISNNNLPKNFSIPNIILFQSTLSVLKLIQLGLNSLNFFPIFLLNFNIEDNEFPALDWIKYCTNKFTEHYIDLSSIYSLRSSISIYCNIPICNLSNDIILFSLDVLFARILKSSKQILWYSENGFPDLGGGDFDRDFMGINNRVNFINVKKGGTYLGYSAEIDIGLFCANAVLESEHLKDYSGKYDNLGYIENKRISNEISNNNSLPYNEYIKKLERYKLERDEFVLGSNAFIIIKKMIEKFLEDVTKYENRAADYLLVHFYRWISSFESKFYDPVLYRLIHLLMQKYFSILVKKINEFGFDIIYADNKKIIIFNGKDNFSEFQNDVDLLFKYIKKITIFNHISLEVNTYWKLLMFRDLFNYSGILASDFDDNFDNEMNKNPKLISKWTIGEFLPSILEKDFISLISDYLLRLYKFFYNKDKEMYVNLKKTYGNVDIKSDEINMIFSKLNDNINLIEKENVINNFKTFLITDYISTKLFNILPNIMMKKRDYDDFDLDEIDEEENENDNENNNDDEINPLFTKDDFNDSFIEEEDYYKDNKEFIDDEIDAKNYKQIVNKNKNYNKNNKKFKKVSTLWKIPEKLGTYNLENRSNLGIEYVNFISEILSLDKEIYTPVFKMKSNCLKLIGIQDFSPESIFKDPCRSFILNDVICESCSNNIDIDFCRDKNYLLNKNFYCERCHSFIDKNMIEFMMIKKVQMMINSYFSSDLECRKCKNQKSEYLFERCQCGEEFEMDWKENVNGLGMDLNNVENMDDVIEAIMSICKYYNFENLAGLLEDFIN